MALIKLDADDVLLDILPLWLKVYSALSDHQLRPEDCYRWELHHLTRPGWEKKVYECRLPELYRRVQPLPGAQHLVRQLQRAGHRLVVVTHDYSSHLTEKMAALRRLYPTLREVVFAKNKNAAVPGGILLDDCHHNNPDVLLTRPWNSTADTMSYGVRANDLYYALTVINRLVEMKDYQNDPFAVR